MRLPLGRRDARWQLHVECTSLTERAPHPDTAAVRFDYELAECEAEAGAAYARNVPSLHASEFLKDQLVKLFGDSGAVVLHSEQ